MRPEKGYNRSYRQGDFPGFVRTVPRSKADEVRLHRKDARIVTMKEITHKKKTGINQPPSSSRPSFNPVMIPIYLRLSCDSFKNNTM